jgi:hypothetical protein
MQILTSTKHRHKRIFIKTHTHTNTDTHTHTHPSVINYYIHTIPFVTNLHAGILKRHDNRLRIFVLWIFVSLDLLESRAWHAIAENCNAYDIQLCGR